MDQPNQQAFPGTDDQRTNEEVDAYIKAMNLLWEYYG